MIAFLKRFVVVDLNSEDILQRYAEIHAFSQGKLKGKPLKASSRNMGKNDIWIAATASVIDGVLLTTDQDFAHLDKTFFDLKLIPIS
ncbi:MAG: type II toxin-antitoxin system VapC family toxin [Bacteroidia bacterium]